MKLTTWRKRLSLKNDNLLGWALMLPAVAILSVFIYFVMFMAFRYSFFKTNLISGAQTFVGLDNYKFLLFEDSTFGIVIKNTLIFTFFTVCGSLIASLSLALICQKVGRWMSIFRTISFIPVVIPMVTAGLIWKMMFEPQFGAVNAFLTSIGLPGYQWLFDTNLSLATVIFVSIWREFGLYTIILVGGLQQISNSLYEAAAMDGADKVQSFFHITLPQLKPTLFFCSTMLLINSFKIFDQIWAMTEGGPGSSTLTIVGYIYQRIFDSVGLANAASVILFIMVVFFTLIQRKFLGGED